MTKRMTPTGDVIAAANGKEQYDEAYKRVLTLKEAAQNNLELGYPILKRMV